jgi:hypothetical protein
MGARMRDEQGRTVGRPSDAPGVGSAAINVVQQDGVDDFHPREVDDGGRVAIHPAAVKLGRGQAEVGQNVGHHGVFAVRRDAQIIEQPAAVGKGEFLGDLAGGGVDDADNRGDQLRVGGAGVQMIRHEEKPPVAADRGSYGLALDRDAALLLPRLQVKEADIVVKAVADEQGFAIRAEHRGRRTVAGGKGGKGLAGVGVEHADAALWRGASHVKTGAIGRECQARRSMRHRDVPGDCAAGNVEDRHLIRRGAGDEEPCAIWCGGKRRR